MRRFALAFPVAVLAAAASSAPARAQPDAPGTIRLSLADSLRAALGRSPEVHQAEADVDVVLGKQLQAQGLGYPQIELTTVFGPAPRARGDQGSSPDDQYSPDVTGAFARGEISIIQPMYTWGLIENARAAAAHGVRAMQAGVDARSTEVALRVKEAYWGLVAARQIQVFLVDVEAQVREAVERTERLVEGGYSTDIDVFRLLAGRGELEKGLALAEKSLALARAALATWTGQPPGTVIEPADATLPADLVEPLLLDDLVREALVRRLEWKQLGEGIEAKRRLAEVERKRRYPLFFAGLFGSAAYASNRDRLDNPFVVDPFNHVAVGPLVGLRYNLDFGIAAGRIHEADAEVRKLEALRQQAVDGIPLQVVQARGSVLEARRNAEYFEGAHRSARKWLVAASSAADLGVGETRDLADAFVYYARTRVEYLQALYAYVLGLDHLAHAVGQDVDEVEDLAPLPAPAGNGGPGGSG